MPGDPNGVQKYLREGRRQHYVKMNMLCWFTEQQGEKLTKWAWDELYIPGHKVATQCNAHCVREHHTGGPNDHFAKTDMQSWYIAALEGLLGEQDTSRPDEHDQGCRIDAKGVRYKGNSCKSKKHERVDKMNTQCQDTDLAAHRGKEVGPEDIEGDWSHGNDRGGVQMDGRQCGRDSTTSEAHHKLKWTHY